MSTFLRDMFDKTGLKQVYVAEKLDIEPRTLQNWLKMKDIEFTVKFIQLLHICNIHTCDFLNMYYKTDEYECKYCKLKK